MQILGQKKRLITQPLLLFLLWCLLCALNFIIPSYAVGNYFFTAFLNTVVSGRNMVETVTMVHTVCGASAKKEE